MSEQDFSKLSRPIQPMPDSVSELLEERGLMDAYRGRPAYQQNDYLAWIARAKRPETKEKRLMQMLEELERGDVYMKMRWGKKGNRKNRRMKEKQEGESNLPECGTRKGFLHPAVSSTGQSGNGITLARFNLLGSKKVSHGTKIVFVLNIA